MTELQMLGVALAVLAVVIPFALWRLRQLKAAGVAAMRARLADEELLIIDDRAIYYGLATRGTIQPRELGGVWALTATRFAYESFPYGSAKIGLEVPIEAISGLEVASNFQKMGASILGGLLVISYRDADGDDEQVALRLADRETAEARLRELTGIGGDEG